MLRPILEIAFALLVGLGLEVTITDRFAAEPPLQLAAVELGLDGYPAPDVISSAMVVAGLPQR
jgi:hypothetical protein